MSLTSYYEITERNDLREVTTRVVVRHFNSRAEAQAFARRFGLNLETWSEAKGETL